MNKTYNRILTEEVKKSVDRLKLNDPNAVSAVLKELFNFNSERLISNIGSVEMDGPSEIAQESWDWFIDAMTDSLSENQEAWLTNIKNVKMRILTYKYFTRQDMIKQEELEGYLRVELKPYWAALQNHVDMKDFMNKVFALPASVLYALVRYMFFVSTELKNATRVTNADLKDRINQILELRLKIADKIGQISNGYQNLLDMNEVKSLFDNGVVFEDNYVNRGICEFIIKMINHDQAYTKLKLKFPSAMIKDLKSQIESSSSYMRHVSSIRDQTGREYFSTAGEQIGKRFDNELEVVRKKEFDGYVVDNDSRLKEPKDKIAQPGLPWESGGGAPVGGPGDASGSAASGGAGGSAGGGGGFGGGGGSFNMSGVDMGGEFAPPGSEGEIPGEEGEPIGQEEDGTPMPTDDTGLPADFGTIEDNGGETGADGESAESEPDAQKVEKKPDAK